VARAEIDSSFRIPKNDSRPSDRLVVQLSGYHPNRRAKWADSVRHRLEELLPQILQEIELRAAEAEQVRLAAIEAAEQRRRQWELAMEQATLDYAEEYRGQILEREIDDWLRTGLRRAYLDAMELVIASLGDPEAGAGSQ
jgi:hypothetical protein